MFRLNWVVAVRCQSRRDNLCSRAASGRDSRRSLRGESSHRHGCGGKGGTFSFWSLNFLCLTGKFVLVVFCGSLEDVRSEGDVGMS